MSRDMHVVLCMPVTSLPRDKVDPGSEVRWCVVCATPIWCSLSTLAHMEREPKLQPMCNECGVPLVEDEPVKRLEAVPGDRRSRREVQEVWQALRRRHGKKP